MTPEQITVFAILAGALVLFIWDRWRFDVVALAALFAAVVTGIVPTGDAFAGFADPVVTTVAAVLVISNAIKRSGVLDAALKLMSEPLRRPGLQIVIFTVLCSAFSAFMNNVGALALFLPAAIVAAQRAGRPPSELLMPLSFSSLLGGLVTLIGTPPNILISGVRERMVGEPFAMFDFAPVGLGIAALGVLYLTLAWKLLPGDRQGKVSPELLFQINDYLAEVRVPAESKLVGMRISEVEAMGDNDLGIVGLVRGRARKHAPSGRTVLKKNDVLLVETDPATLKHVTDFWGLELVGNKDLTERWSQSDDVGAMEAVVMGGSELIGRSPTRMRLRSRFGVNLLAVRRGGRAVRGRLRNVRLKEGDVVVLQGNTDHMPQTLMTLGCLPLAERNLQLGRPRQIVLPPLVLAGAVAATMMGLVPIQIAFLGAVLVIMVLQVLTLKDVYESVDWPIVILLGALIPVTVAFERTGCAELLAGWLAQAGQGLPGYALLTLVLVATLLITPVLNNGATVLLMAPVAVGLAQQMDFRPDAFLMAVAIGASCDFLTPIGHQSNTLVMGPGGYKFTDYWRLGLPLTVMVVAAGVPLIMLVWPL